MALKAFTLYIVKRRQFKNVTRYQLNFHNEYWDEVIRGVIDYTVKVYITYFSRVFYPVSPAFPEFL
jgi:hypothetical protein